MPLFLVAALRLLFSPLRNHDQKCAGRFHLHPPPDEAKCNVGGVFNFRMARKMGHDKIGDKRMKDAQKPDHASLSTMITRICDGRYVVPDFQREFEWRPQDICDLIRSIFSDYYIGSILLWKAKKQNLEILSCEKLYGYSGESSGHGKESPEYIVLDGQQRLTAIHYAFRAPNIALPKRAKRAVYFIRIDKFMADETDDAFSYEWLSIKKQSHSENDPAHFIQHKFPLSVLGGDTGAPIFWALEYENFWKERKNNATTDDEREIASIHVNNARSFGKEVSNIMNGYQISYIELDKEIGIDKVCDIFAQINQKGKKLDVFDLLNALMRPRHIKLKQMYKDVQGKLDFIEASNMNVYILQVMSILKQNYCSPKYLYFLQPGFEKTVRREDGTKTQVTLIKDADEFVELWDQAVKALERAINLLKNPQEYGAVGQAYIPYVSIIPAFAAINTLVSAQPDKRQIMARRKFRLWYWASVFSNRYSSAVEATAAQDFITMHKWIANTEDVTKPDFIDEFANTHRQIDMHNETKRSSSIYSAIFNLFVLAGARDWRTGDIPRYDNLDAHHIVPVSWGRQNIPGDGINSILNRSPLTSETNRNFIGDKLPHSYLPELIDANGKDKMLNILESHFISKAALDILLKDPFTREDYDDFLNERHRTLLDGIENLLIKERFDLPKKLRDIDVFIEEIELALRKIIVDAVGNDLNILPSHLLDRAQERIQKTLRKNAALNSDHYKTTEGVLEYFDLREIQDTITSKVLWDRFSRRFNTKEALNQKFSQLADLRNGIRHSRNVDDITFREGEASVLWFRRVLNL